VKVQLTSVILALALLAAPLVVEAQQGGKVRRIGLLTISSEQPQRELADAFRRGLAELGYVEGQNIVIEHRSAQGRVERFPDLFAELARLEVDLILSVGGTPVARAAKQANVTIPVIVPAMGDPVGDGVVVSLAHLGGNITGSTFLGPALVPKRIELLKEAIPGLSRVAALWHPRAYGDRTMAEMLKETEAAGQKLGVKLQLLEARSANDFARAFSAMTREHVRALVVCRAQCSMVNTSASSSSRSPVGCRQYSRSGRPPTLAASCPMGPTSPISSAAERSKPTRF
jgi:putative tryptophan/tyrosine transport system substrate-binding protein